MTATKDEIYALLVDVYEERNTRERWWGAAAAPTEKNAIAKTISVPFVATSGNDTWGPAIPIIGSRDDPAPKGSSYFHIHRINIEEVSSDTTWMFRLLYSNYSLEEAAQAQRYTEKLFASTVAVALLDHGRSFTIRSDVLHCGQCKVWAQVWNATNLATLEFYIGVHGHSDPVLECDL